MSRWRVAGAVVLLGVLAAPAAHAQGIVSLDEPGLPGLMALGALAFALRGVGRYNAHRFRDPRMDRRHPGVRCNCKACVDAYPGS
jgi:hypothetical protein